MRHRIINALAITAMLSGVAMAQPVKAEKTLADYNLPGAHGLDITKTYLQGISDGLGWANATLIAAGKPALFCQPDRLGLKTDNIEDILNRYLSEHATVFRAHGDYPIGMMLLASLKEAFPCSAS